MTALPGSIPRISPDFKLSVTVRGLKIEVAIVPGCLGRGRRLQLRATHRIAGSADLVSRRLSAKVTKAEIRAMLQRLRVVSCRARGCSNRRLVGDVRESGQKVGLCSPHRLKNIHRAMAKELTQEDAQTAHYDAWMWSKGFRYKATVWIYRGDRDESAVALYCANKPPRAQLREEAERRQSRILDDFSIERLRRE